MILKSQDFFERFLGFLRDFWGFYDEFLKEFLESFKGFLKSFGDLGELFRIVYRFLGFI